MSDGRYSILDEIRQLLVADECGEELDIRYSVSLTVNRNWSGEERVALTVEERAAFEALALQVARRIGLIE